MTPPIQPPDPGVPQTSKPGEKTLLYKKYNSKQDSKDSG